MLNFVCNQIFLDLVLLCCEIKEGKPSDAEYSDVAMEIYGRARVSVRKN